MCLYIASLNSGSNGNCYYIGNDNEAVLIDAGLSCRETEKRMKRLGLLIKNIKALFVSHEHADHIFGIPVLAKKYQLPVYITTSTLLYSGFKIDKHLIVPFRTYEPVNIGALSITPFPKFHDASDPHSFMVEGNSVKVGVFTDIGIACDHVTMHFKQCNAAFLEANYDEQMLATGRYPYYLKERIKSIKGHLSNNAALQLFTSHKPSWMSHLILSHLSKNNNRPELVQQLFNKHAGTTRIIIASRYSETSVYQINNISEPLVHSGRSVNQKPLQLSFFES
ncbi:MAG TPA: MBL fold metallo-hydrolase [Chitinophagaceae bacterium]|jgi:phosphoribosyl 1,2-cyclic phosphodiesterase